MNRLHSPTRQEAITVPSHPRPNWLQELQGFYDNHLNVMKNDNIYHTLFSIYSYYKKYNTYID